RVEKYVERQSRDDCWPWRGALNNNGYGVLKVAGKNARAHRLAWTLEHGPIPNGLNVLHRCDNPPCCNPAHLFLGTLADNSADAARKGRMCHGDRHHSRAQRELRPRGEQHRQAKLTDGDVLAIRQLYRDGHSQRELARRFGVSKSAVGCLVRGQTWTH